MGSSRSTVQPCGRSTPARGYGLTTTRPPSEGLMRSWTGSNWPRQTIGCAPSCLLHHCHLGNRESQQAAAAPACHAVCTRLRAPETDARCCRWMEPTPPPQLSHMASSSSTTAEGCRNLEPSRVQLGARWELGDHPVRSSLRGSSRCCCAGQGLLARNPPPPEESVCQSRGARSVA